jgi:hypothetical protein
MSSNDRLQVNPEMPRRRWAFRLGVGLSALFPVVLTLVTLDDLSRQRVIEGHAVHTLAEFVIEGIWLSMLIAIMRRPTNEAAYWGLIAVVATLGAASVVALSPVAGIALFLALVLTLILRSRPPRVRLSLHMRFPRTPSALMTLVAVVPAVHYALNQASFQRSLPANDPHVTMQHFTDMTWLPLLLVALAIITCAKPTGAWLTRVIVGFAASALGAIFLFHTTGVSSVTPAWALLWICVGVVFAAVGALDKARSQPTTVSGPAPRPAVGDCQEFCVTG